MKSTLFAIGALAATAVASPTRKHAMTNGPFVFTSTYSIVSVPEEVVDADGEFTGGLEGSKALVNLGINSYDNVFCYNVTLKGFEGEYESPALTATHIHEGEKGSSGPPRIVFDDPEGEGDIRTAFGCVRGPFETGVVNDGEDEGEGFHVKQIEKNPSDFYFDVHSSLAVPGANRAQLTKKKDGCP